MDEQKRLESLINCISPDEIKNESGQSLQAILFKLGRIYSLMRNRVQWVEEVIQMSGQSHHPGTELDWGKLSETEVMIAGGLESLVWNSEIPNHDATDSTEKWLGQWIALYLKQGHCEDVKETEHLIEWLAEGQTKKHGPGFRKIREWLATKIAGVQMVKQYQAKPRIWIRSTIVASIFMALLGILYVLQARDLKIAGWQHQQIVQEAAQQANELAILKKIQAQSQIDMAQAQAQLKDIEEARQHQENEKEDWKKKAETSQNQLVQEKIKLDQEYAGKLADLQAKLKASESQAINFKQQLEQTQEAEKKLQKALKDQQEEAEKKLQKALKDQQEEAEKKLQKALKDQQEEAEKKLQKQQADCEQKLQAAVTPEQKVLKQTIQELETQLKDLQQCYKAVQKEADAAQQEVQKAKAEVQQVQKAKAEMQQEIVNLKEKLKAPPGFQYLRTATYSCNGVTNIVKEYQHIMTGLEFVLIPEGSFSMGSPPGEYGRRDDEMQHTVKLSSYLISKTEVTQEVWESVMHTKPSDVEGTNFPVNRVSWHDCITFCEQTRLTLPTEAQWEYACRAGTQTAYYFGERSNAKDYAWYDDNSKEIQPVAQKKPNAYGLYDMAGNLGEWCRDEYAKSLQADVLNPVGPSGGNEKVIRGGSWDDLIPCRSAKRNQAAPSFPSKYIGFRVAVTLPSSESDAHK